MIQVFEIDASDSNIEAVMLEDMILYYFEILGRKDSVSVKELSDIYDEPWCHSCDAPLQNCEEGDES